MTIQDFFWDATKGGYKSEFKDAQSVISDAAIELGSEFILCGSFSNSTGNKEAWEAVAKTRGWTDEEMREKQLIVWRAVDKARIDSLSKI